MNKLDFYLSWLQDCLINRRYADLDRQSNITRENGSAILMFHHLGDVLPQGMSDSIFSTVDDFLSIIQTSSPKRIVPLDSLIQDIKRSVTPPNEIVITFDDIYSSVVDLGLPLMQKHNVPFTVYIATSFLDKPNYISTQQLLELSREPLCTIGAHTVSHPKLKEKGVDIHHELIEAKKILEDIIGRKVNHLAYPYGTPFAVSKSIVKYVKESNLYESAVSTIPGYINESSLKNLFFLPRIHSELYLQQYS